MANLHAWKQIFYEGHAFRFQINKTENIPLLLCYINNKLVKSTYNVEGRIMETNVNYISQIIYIYGTATTNLSFRNSMIEFKDFKCYLQFCINFHSIHVQHAYSDCLQ